MDHPSCRLFSGARCHSCTALCLCQSTKDHSGLFVTLGSDKTALVAKGAVAPPVPIPNTVVQRPSADDTGGGLAGTIGRRRLRLRRGVEQWQLVGLITRRSPVRIRPPLPTEARGIHGYLGLLAVLALPHVPPSPHRGVVTTSGAAHHSLYWRKTFGVRCPVILARAEYRGGETWPCCRVARELESPRRSPRSATHREHDH